MKKKILCEKQNENIYRVRNAEKKRKIIFLAENMSKVK